MRSRWLALAAAAGCAGLAGCLDLSVADLAFPPTIAGLPADQPWFHLPVGVWMTEGDVEARAIAACTAPSCPGRTVVGVFRARGRAAERLAALAARPDRLLAELGSRTGRDRGARPPAKPVVLDSRRVQVGTLSGVSVAMSRPGGGGAVHGLALVAPRPGGLTVVIVVGESETAALRIATAVEAGSA